MLMLCATVMVGFVTTQAAVVQGVAPIKVVAGNDVVADLVRAVGGANVTLLLLGKAGGDPHHYEPTPADAKKIESADVVIQFGLGLDRAIGKLHTSTGSKATLLVLAEGLGKSGDAAAAAEHDHAHDHAHDHGHDHGPTAVDPHIWHDPSKVRVLNERLCAVLVAARPELADFFRARSRDFNTQLTQLDEWIKTQIQRIPEAKRMLVTTHDGLRSFGDRYGFRVVGIEMMGDGADVAPAQLIKMVKALQETKSPVVFGDADHPSRIAATVAREAKVRLVETLRLDSLLQLPTVAEGKAYLETMRSNVNMIVEALHE